MAARRSRWVALAAVDFEAFDATVGDATRNLVIAGLVFAGAAGFGSYGLARAALSPVVALELPGAVEGGSRGQDGGRQ